MLEALTACGRRGVCSVSPGTDPQPGTLRKVSATQLARGRAAWFVSHGPGYRTVGLAVRVRRAQGRVWAERGPGTGPSVGGAWAGHRAEYGRSVGRAQA